MLVQSLGPIWYYSEPSDVPYSPNQFLGWDFFAVSYTKAAVVSPYKKDNQSPAPSGMSQSIENEYVHFIQTSDLLMT